MKFKFIGLGAAGNKAVLELINQKCCKEEDVLLVNSTDKDFPANYSGRKIILKQDNTGCGKERAVAKECALTNVSAFDDLENTCEEVVLVASMEGGTGSGALPIIANYLDQVLGKNIHIVGFKGFEDDVRGLQNTVEFMQDISKLDVDIMLIDNKTFIIDNANRFEIEKAANIEFCNRMRVLTGQDIMASTQNIDDTDIKKVVNTIGYKTIETFTFGNEVLTSRELFNKKCRFAIAFSKSVKCENPGMQRLAVIANIMPESEDGIDDSFSTIKDHYGVPYECFFHKQYDGKEQYISFICSGMKLPIDDLEATYEKYKEQSNLVNKERDEFADKAAELAIDPLDLRYDCARGTNRVKIDKSDFISKYETK